MAGCDGGGRCAMNLLRFVWRTCRSMMVWTTLMALLSGACNAALIAFVNAALTNSHHWSGALLLWCFVAVGVGKIVTAFVSQALLTGFSQGVIADVRRDLIRKILKVPLQQLEEIGAPRVLVALTDDVFSIAQALL